MGKFKVGDEVEVTKAHRKFNKGDVLEVIEVDKQDSLLSCLLGNADKQDWAFEEYLKLLNAKVTKKQRIEALENELAATKEEVAELKLIVHQLRERKETTVNVTIDNPSTDDIADDPFYWVDYPLNEEKTPNQLRAEVIEKAKVFLETSKSEWEGLVLTDSLKGQRHKFTDVYQVYLNRISSTEVRVAACDVEFVVNEGKRTIVALMRGIENKKVYDRGIAKCDPNDVFNEHIGKAISLGRALGLDVSEFEQAVQPNEAVVGMKFIDRHGDAREIVNDEEWCTRESMKSHIESDNVQVHSIKITNDTNAIYGD